MYDHEIKNTSLLLAVASHSANFRPRKVRRNPNSQFLTSFDAAWLVPLSSSTTVAPLTLHHSIMLTTSNCPQTCDFGQRKLVNLDLLE
jgi:hypothetical protein